MSAREAVPSAMKQRMLAGELYQATPQDLSDDYWRALELTDRYNALRGDDTSVERDALLRELLGSVGDGVQIRPNVRFDYGYNTHIGAGTFVNFDCVFLDVVEIRIGTNCQIATKVQLLTAEHPIDPGPRRDQWESARPITIGDNVWLGGGVIVGPGVTIGDNTVVGAGAVVTRDLPANVVAVGVPARVLREIGPGDAINVPELDDA